MSRVRVTFENLDTGGVIIDPSICRDKDLSDSLVASLRISACINRREYDEWMGKLAERVGIEHLPEPGK